MNQRIDILSKLEILHSNMCEKISELNRNYNLTENEWEMLEVISTFKSELKLMKDKLQVINDKIIRENIKIYLFGRVNVGKSAVINSILNMDLFLSASSHTTSCFVNIKKSQDVNFKIKVLDKEETCDTIEEVKDKIKCLSTVFSEKEKMKLKTNEIIELFIHIENNKVLKNNTEIIDCPGSGNEVAITNHLSTQAKDAAIFICVTEGGILEDYKAFFTDQENHSTKPDVFILINKWDNSDDDNDSFTKTSKNNIFEKCQKFLNNLGIRDNQEIKERIYFISAREVLQVRIKKDNEKIKRPKAKERYESFERFEEILSNYVDKFLKNKNRRYEVEIKQINNDIIGKIVEYEKKIFDLKNVEGSYNYDKFISDLNDLKEKNNEMCDKKMTELQNKMKADLEEIRNGSATNNKEWANRELNGCKSDLIKKFEVFSKQIFESLINKSHLFRERKLTLRNAINTLDDQDNNRDTLIKFKRWITKIVNIFHGLPKKQRMDDITDLILEANQNIKENINTIKTEIGNSITNIENIFVKKKRVLTQFWNEMENIWN